MSNKLSLMPNIAIPRSKFKQSFNHSLDMKHGLLVPVDCFEVVPGDEFSYTLSSLIRMSTPILPIMGNIKARVDAWFVPLRLIWDDAEKFYGDPSNHDKVSSITPVNPATVSIPFVGSSYFAGGVHEAFLNSVQDYLGKIDLLDIRNNYFSSDLIGWNTFLSKLRLSVLKERAYLTIWNDGYRPSLMVPPVLVSKGTNASYYGTASFLSNPNLTYCFQPLKAFKQYDYFTAGTLSPQYGSAVSLPLGVNAPVYISNQADTVLGSPYYMGFVGNGTKEVAAFSIGTNSDVTAFGSTSKLYADLELATAASINEIRYAFQLQKYFERSNYGNRYFEILNAHYGITNPDSRLQRAERLGSHEFYINISQVVSTADTESGSNGQPVGHTGAVSVTGDNCHLFTKSFSEPGYIMVLITTKYDRSYASGVLREDIKKNRFEFYSPEFANLGDQATKAIEIHTVDGNGNLVDPEAVHSYNEHWAEYRYRKDRVSGSLRPGNSLDIWTLADDFDNNDATPGYNFLAEDRASLARVLSSGLTGPDYICDFHANIIATRELPLYSIPGLIDHFGAL